MRFRSFFCLVQCSLPLVSGVVLCLRQDGVGNLKVTMSWAMEGCKTIEKCLALPFPAERHLMSDTSHLQIQRAFLKRRSALS